MIMRLFIRFAGAVLLATAPLAWGDTGHERTQGPCYTVSIQIERTNHSQVRQTCDVNVNRTVQAGQQNHAETWQTGIVNDNKVRQYRHDAVMARPSTRSE
jgi:hypothetical protein